MLTDVRQRRMWFVAVSTVMTGCGSGDASSQGADGGGADASLSEASADAGVDAAAVVDGADSAPPGPQPPSSVHASALQLWLTADKGVACDTHVTPNLVSTWADQSSRGHDATAFTGTGAPLAPRCNQNRVRKGVELVQFIAPLNSQPKPTLSIPAGVIGGGAFTMLLVVQSYGYAQPTVPFIKLGSASLGYTNGNNVTTLLLQITNDQTVGNVGRASPNEGSILLARFDPAVGGQVWMNGTKAGESVTKTPPTNGLGFLGSYSGQPIDYDVAEVIVYDVALNDVERVSVEGYLKNRWGI